MRNGKIATLPSTIRDQLNWRMENGEDGADLLTWLNALPEVKERTKGDNAVAPINKQNLSEWRLGGFREWHLHHELRHAAYRLSEHAGNISDSVDAPLMAGNMAVILAARYAALLNSWDGVPTPEFEDKLRVLRGLNRDLALLQKTLQQSSRHEAETAQRDEDQMEKQREKWKKIAMAPMQAAMERNSNQGIFEMFFPRATASRMAELAAAIKYNLPLPKKGRSAASGQTRSKPVKPLRAHASPRPIPSDPTDPTDSGSIPNPQSAIRNPQSFDPQSCDPRPTQSDPTDPPQTGSNPVKPSQSETSGLPLEPQSADGELQTAP
jgi:hypothetical protein